MKGVFTQHILFTDQQIKTITSGAIGKYFANFFPTPKDQREAQEKVNAARKHIAAAGCANVQ